MDIRRLVPTKSACDPAAWEVSDFPPLDPAAPLAGLSRKHFYLFDMPCDDFRVFDDIKADVPHPIVPGRTATVYFAISTNPKLADWVG